MLPGPMGAEAVGMVANDLTVFEKEEAGISGANVRYDGVAFPH